MSVFKNILIAVLVLIAQQLCSQQLIFRVFDAQNKLVFEKKTISNNKIDTLNFSFSRSYQLGDYFTVEGAQFLNIQLDENIPACDVFSPTGKLKFLVPINQQNVNYPIQSFAGSEHKIVIRKTNNKELSLYRNLALNSFDIRGNSNFYPHATSNSECRGETYYAARNAIDGYKANKWHGKWPYQSWGPDKGDSLWFKIDFGRKVSIDKLVIINRAQYADLHDSYWNEAIIEFSDGKTERIKIGKTDAPQEIKIKKHKTSSVKFLALKADEPKWCAWIEVEVWGK